MRRRPPGDGSFDPRESMIVLCMQFTPVMQYLYLRAYATGYWWSVPCTLLFASPLPRNVYNLEWKWRPLGYNRKWPTLSAETALQNKTLESYQTLKPGGVRLSSPPCQKLVIFIMLNFSFSRSSATPDTPCPQPGASYFQSAAAGSRNRVGVSSM